MQFAESVCDVYDFTFRQILEKLIPNDMENEQNFLFLTDSWPILTNVPIRIVSGMFDQV